MFNLFIFSKLFVWNDFIDYVFEEINILIKPRLNKFSTVNRFFDGGNSVGKA